MKHGLSARLEKLENRQAPARPVILFAGDAQEFEQAQEEEKQLKAQGREALLVTWVFPDEERKGV